MKLDRLRAAPLLPRAHVMIYGTRYGSMDHFESAGPLKQHRALQFEEIYILMHNAADRRLIHKCNLKLALS